GDYHVCAFGTPASRAVATIALLGDSHAAHWRAALDVVARAKRWHVLSIALSGCPYSTATRVLPDPLHRACVDRNAQMPAWFADHPEVHTVFVSELSGARWMFPPGSDQFESQVAAYVDAWSRLPPSVEHVVVIRDSPKAEEKTRACIE